MADDSKRDENKPDDSLELEAGLTAEGGAHAKVRVDGLQRALAFVFPQRVARAELTVGLAQSATQKLAQDKNLSVPEAALVGHLLRDELETLRRRLEIADRAEEAFPLMRRRLAPPDDSKASEPDGDWLRRFWADAELIDDETMRVIYARILAGECARPGTFSRGALAVLRDLDTLSAHLFAIMRNLAIGPFLPRTGELKAYIERMGLDFGSRMQLADAGLLRDKHDVTYLVEPDETKTFRCGEKILLLGSEGKDSRPFECFALTTAAIELLAIADVKHDENYFQLVLPWIAGHGYAVAWAVSPRPGPLSGDELRGLEWTEWTPPAPPPAVPAPPTPLQEKT